MSTSEEIPISVPPTETTELAMETQTVEHKKKFNYNKVHVSLIVFIKLKLIRFVLK